MKEVKGKCILITGGGGSLGRSLVPLLVDENQVWTLGGTRMEGAEHIQCDFSKVIDTSTFPEKVDVIVHLAQSGEFRDFPAKGLEVFEVNTYSTMILADYAAKVGASKFIYASSGGVYGFGENPYPEESTWDINQEGLYIKTKMCSELILSSYTSLFNVINLRFFFMYGPNQNSDMLIPRLIRNVRENRENQVFQDGGLRINPIYVEDAAHVVLNSILYEDSGIFNVGGNEIVSIRDIVESISKQLQQEPVFKVLEGKSYSLIGDSTKMLKELYRPQIAFSMGVNKMLLK